jgi:hypothetical protein
MNPKNVLSGRSRHGGMALALIGAMLGLAACGNQPEGEKSPLSSISTVKSLAGGIFGSRNEVDDNALAAALPAQIERALASTPGPVAVMIFDKTGVMDGVSPIQRNGAHETWQTEAGVALNFLGGVVVSTRGLGDDLMASEADAAEALIRSRGTGSVERAYFHLNGLGQTQRFRMTCTIAPGDEDRVTAAGIDMPATIMVENCVNGPYAKQNLYWVSRDGRVLRSYQWIGASLGHVTVMQLRL